MAEREIVCELIAEKDFSEFADYLNKTLKEKKLKPINVSIAAYGATWGVCVIGEKSE